MIGLNPSIADQWQDDNTVRREKRFAADWEYGALIKTNVFGLVSTDRMKLYDVEDPVGPGNTVGFLQDKMSQCQVVVAAWGAEAMKVDSERVEEVLHGFPQLHCLRLNDDGSPEHPLYLPKTLNPVPYNF